MKPVVCFVLVALALHAAGLAAAADPSFTRDIKGILSNRCVRCHGPDPEGRAGGGDEGLRLDTFAGATADLGGWDEHDAMGSPTDPNGNQTRLVAGLDAAIGAFFDWIGGAAARTTVIVTTEFGRRIALNGSGGTDHGRGMVMMVLGGGVNPGVHGDWPGLVDTDAGDVRVVNDHRRVLAEVLGRRGRAVDLSTVFTGVDVGPSRWLGVTWA